MQAAPLPSQWQRQQQGDKVQPSHPGSRYQRLSKARQRGTQTLWGVLGGWKGWVLKASGETRAQTAADALNISTRTELVESVILMFMVILWLCLHAEHSLCRSRLGKKEELELYHKKKSADCCCSDVEMWSCNEMLNYWGFRWNGISPLRMATLDGKTEEINGKSSLSIF